MKSGRYDGVREIGGEVAYVVLATTQYEHKVFCGPFSRRFPDAQVWVAPGQFSFPLNLPNQFFGIFPAGELDKAGQSARPPAHLRSSSVGS